MTDSLSLVESRIKKSISSYNSIMLLREDGPLIEPNNCEIINECQLETEMVSTYERHINYLKSYFFSNSSPIKRYLNSIGYLGDIFEITITTLACAEYVAATYLENSYKDTFLYLDLVIASIFMIDWVVHLIVADKKWDFILSYVSLIDYLTVIPVYIEFFGSSLGIKVSFFRVLRVFRALRILRLFKTLDALAEEDEDDGAQKYRVDTSGISKQILITSIILLSVLFIGAGIVNSVNDLVPGAYYYPSNSDFDFLAAFYYMIVTSSTLGYGDIYPQVTVSRMITVVIIIFMVFTITNQLSKISQLMANYSKYDTQYNFKEHIVIVGNYQARTLNQFLAQFYHPDHGEVKTRSIIIGNEYPSSEIIGILGDSRYDGKINYLEGNPSLSSTWRNANLELAESVFIITDQLSENLTSQDTYAILLARMIQCQCPLIKTYVQLIRPLSLTMNTDPDAWNTVISLQTIKMSLLGTSIHNVGFSTLMGGLYLTFGSLSNQENDKEWITLFSKGLAQEIYCVKISDFFINMNFNQAVDIIYTHCKGILTIGVKSLIGISSKHEILINPVSYKFKRDDLVFVITNDQSTADLITTYSDTFDYKTTNVSSFAQIALSHNFQTVKLLGKEYLCEIKNKSIVDLVQEDINGKMAKHVLVFGELEGFELLIQAIRVYSNQPICLVNNNEPDVQWEKLSRYENVFYFKGNMMHFQDLYNTGIKNCYSVLILSNINSSGLSPDSEVILLTKLIEYSFPNVRITVELIDKSYIRFMGSRPKGKYKKLPYNLWPNAVSGKVYFSSYLDSFICQTYYNTDLLDVILRIMGITKNSQNTLLENSIIRTVKIPKFYFQGRLEPLSYGEVFRDLLHLNPPVIPLGILSKSFTTVEGDSDLENMKKIDQPIVFTNPSAGTLIQKSDKIICIGEPKDDHSAEMSSDKKIEGENVFTLGLAELMIKAKTAQVAQHDEGNTEEKEAISYLFNILKKRMESSAKLQASIEAKNKLIQELQKEADGLKEQLIGQHSQ